MVFILLCLCSPQRARGRSRILETELRTLNYGVSTWKGILGNVFCFSSQAGQVCGCSYAVAVHGRELDGFARVLGVALQTSLVNLIAWSGK